MQNDFVSFPDLKTKNTGTSEEKWAHLCLDEGVERLILGRIEGSGLSPHIQSAVQREIEKSRARDDAIEGAVYSSVASLGTYAFSYCSSFYE